jgi:RimJ/RimL family protein N-acetyltransferase
MMLPKKYKCLKKNIFSDAKFSIIPIRYQDRIEIMNWRNEQMYHLRQVELLTEENQENYFNTVVAKLFEEEKPSQLLFSYLKDGICIGYGGLVHINWIDRNSEISFIMNTQLETIEFELHWSNFIALLEKVAFEEMKLHKISTYAFDLRPRIYEVFESNGFYKEAELKEQCYYENQYINVIIHSKIK